LNDTEISVQVWSCLLFASCCWPTAQCSDRYSDDSILPASDNMVLAGTRHNRGVASAARLGLFWGCTKNER